MEQDPVLLQELASARLQVTAFHSALRILRTYLDNVGKLPEEVARPLDEALGFSSATGAAIFENLRLVVAAAKDPGRYSEVPVLAERIEHLVGGSDGQV